MKKYSIGLLVVLFCASVTSFASRKDEVTLLLLPREDGALRVGMDIAKRYPTLLLSYKSGANGAVSLHGWSGNEWVNVSLEDFHAGNFFKTGPDSALVVEQDGVEVPETLIPPADWCSSVYKITTSEIRPLLHLVGQYYDFKYKEWDWFSENYRLPLDAINPEGLNVSWYHKRAADNLKKRESIGADDLQYWVTIRHPQPLKPEMETDVPESIEEEDTSEQPVMEIPSDPVINPLTNAVPEAIVLSAGDADEVKIETSSDIPEGE